MSRFSVFRKKKNVDRIVKLIPSLLDRPITLMHVCGTHENTISHWGLRSLLPKDLRLVAGPGCPVCVCPAQDVDQAIWLGEQGVLICSFGDMMRVPASRGSLFQAKARGADVRIVYGIGDAVELARREPAKKIVFFGIGFETTAPMTAAELFNNPPENFSILSSYRLVPPAMEALLSDKDSKIDGFICPGHVSTVIGAKAYEPISKKFRAPCVVAGFEPLDMLLGVLSLIKQLNENRAEVENVYRRAVSKEGNLTAQKYLQEVFQIQNTSWRGIGVIPMSGYSLKNEFDTHNACLAHEIPEMESSDLVPGCRCPDVMLGKIFPKECPLFLSTCKPENPVGPCMVGQEGTCSIHAKYGSEDFFGA